VNRVLILLLTCLGLGLGAVGASDIESDVVATQQAVQTYVNRSVGTFESYQEFTLGDPAQKLYEVANRAKEVGLPALTMSLAVMIAILGFVVRGWSIISTGDQVSKRGVFFQAVLVSALLSLSYNNPLNMSVSYTALTSWNNSIKWSNSKFTGAMDEKLRESSGIMVGVLGKVAVTATTLAAPQLRALGAASSRAALAGGAKAVAAKGTSQMVKIGSKLNFSLLFMQGLLIAYANIIFISGITVLVGIYLFPIAVALTMWGQTKPIWTIVGSFISAWAIALVLPLVTYLSIDKVFVEPARMAAKYENEMGLAAMISGTQSTLVGEKFDSEVERITRECKAKQETDPNISCITDSNKGLLKGVWKGIMGGLNTGLELFKETVGRLVDTIASLVIQVFYGIAYYIFSIGAMFAIATYITGVLGGAATNLGNAIKGRIISK